MTDANQVLGRGTGSAPSDGTGVAWVEHRDEHVSKLADTALDVYDWTGSHATLDAVQRVASLIDRA